MVKQVAEEIPVYRRSQGNTGNVRMFGGQFVACFGDFLDMIWGCLWDNTNEDMTTEEEAVSENLPEAVTDSVIVKEQTQRRYQVKIEKLVDQCTLTDIPFYDD